MKLLQNKVAIITGASRGIGKGIAEKFAEQGCNIAFTFLSSVEKAKAFETELATKYGVKVKGYQSDAADFKAADQLVTDVVAEFGTVDVLVNNAGITRDTLLMRMSEQQWDEVMNANLKSVFNLTKAVQKPMLKARSGSIINMSSVVGVKGNAGQANYSAIGLHPPPPPPPPPPLPADRPSPRRRGAIARNAVGIPGSLRRSVAARRQRARADRPYVGVTGVGGSLGLRVPGAERCGTVAS